MARAACNYESMATAPAFTKITRGLYMGSKRVIKESNIEIGRPMFAVYVSAAKEVRPPRDDYGQFETIWIKMDDVPWNFKKDIKTLDKMIKVTGTLADLVKQGYRIVIFCNMGMNRSGFITALTLMNLGWPLRKALAKIRERHQCTLSNHSFVKALAFVEDNYF